MEQTNAIIQYAPAVQTIKTAILQGQYEAAKGVNRIQLAVYFAIGKYISANTRTQAWGTHALEFISEQLRRELPGLRGFSETSLKKMRQFYEQWQILENRPPVTDEMESIENDTIIEANAIAMLNRPPMADELDVNEFLSISFTHHDEILSKTTTLEERVFYIHKVATMKWDKYTLRDNLKADLYHHQSVMPNNFVATIPDKRLAMKTLKMFKDEYLLDFINVEEIDETDPEDIDERVIEKSIVMNIKNFIMTFGKGFTFIGNQVHYDKLGQDHWIDLLFYNRDLRRIVVFELKSGRFKVEYLAQLSSYLRVLNDDDRREGENPPIGMVLCKKMNKEYVNYIMQDFRQPMGVATYKTADEIAPELLEVLPPKEELAKLLDEKED